MHPDGNSATQVGASPDAIRAHYDLGDDFYRLWLDPEMIYSCALFDRTEDLAAAQIAKLDYHIAAAAVTQGMRVLEIGCGWGAMLRRLVDHVQVKHAVGLTLSPSQARWVQRSGRPGLTVLQQHWQDHLPDHAYDAIISIGAFEHFVHPGMAGAAKLAAYRRFFAWCDRALVPGGRLSLQTIAYPAPLGERDRNESDFIAEKIFPQSELPLIWEPIAAAEGLFELVTLRNDREDYYKTLRLWEKNLVAQSEPALALVGEEKFADFRRYLRMTAAAFKRGNTCLLRMSFVKRR